MTVEGTQPDPRVAAISQELDASEARAREDRETLAALVVELGAARERETALAEALEIANERGHAFRSLVKEGTLEIERLTARETALRSALAAATEVLADGADLVYQKWFPPFESSIVPLRIDWLKRADDAVAAAREVLGDGDEIVRWGAGGSE